MKKAILTILLILPSMAFAQNTKGDIQMFKFDQFYQYLNALYVDTLNNEKLIEEAIKKVLSELDPHSSYSSAEEMKSISESFEGSFSGIGVEFDILNDTLTVVNTITGGPAERVGVMPNDKIVTIDGTSSVGIARTEVPKRLRGPKGTIVEISVKRRGVNDPLKFRITRDNIPINTIDAAYKINAHTGYIRVNRFAETTMKEFREAFKKLGKTEALILDMRGNGGGLLDQAIELSEFFLPAGSLIVSTEGRTVKSSAHVSRKNGTFLSGPLVVLIDAGSASGSEIVAGAIQDWDRGIVIGQPSFGKGLVQRQIPLIDESAVRITVARYHTPTGRVIQRPYEKGKTDDYYMDHFRRAYDRNYADSVNSEAPVYYTLKSNRRVIGGGGIYPDIYVPIDTTKNYSYWNRLVRAGIVNEFVNSYLERERDNLKNRFSTFESFDSEFNVDSAMIEALKAMGRAQKIEYAEKADALSLNDTKIHVKALIAQKLWGSTEYFRIINSADDEAFKAAYDAVRNWETSRRILEKQP